MHSGQVNVRKSWPVQLGSIAESFIAEPQAVHCGPWFCLSSMVLPSVRSPEFARKPTGYLGCEGIRCNDVDLNVIALRTLEQPLFETSWPRCHALQHHPRLAARTARAFDVREELLGRGHGALLHEAGALPDSQSPMIAIGGAVMSQPCSSMFGNGWSIVLSDENFTNSCIRRPDWNDCRPFSLSVNYRMPSPPASDE